MGYIEIDWGRVGIESAVNDAVEGAEAAFIAAEGLLLNSQTRSEQPVAELISETGSYMMFINGKPVTFAPPAGVHKALELRSLTVRGYAEPRPTGRGVQRLDSTLRVLQSKIDFRTGETNGLSSVGCVYTTPRFGDLAVLRLGLGEGGRVKWSVGPYPNRRGAEI